MFGIRMGDLGFNITGTLIGMFEKHCVPYMICIGQHFSL
jgi:hypothetical protein